MEATRIQVCILVSPFQGLMWDAGCPQGDALGSHVEPLRGRLQTLV